MIRDTFFSLHRFVNVCRKEMVENWKTYILRSVMVYGSDNKLLYMLPPKEWYPCLEVPQECPTPTLFQDRPSARAMLNAANGTLQASQQTDYYSFGLSFEDQRAN